MSKEGLRSKRTSLEQVKSVCSALAKSVVPIEDKSEVKFAKNELSDAKTDKENDNPATLKMSLIF